MLNAPDGWTVSRRAEWCAVTGPDGAPCTRGAWHTGRHEHRPRPIVAPTVRWATPDTHPTAPLAAIPA